MTLQSVHVSGYTSTAPNPDLCAEPKKHASIDDKHQFVLESLKPESSQSRFVRVPSALSVKDCLKEKKTWTRSVDMNRTLEEGAAHVTYPVGSSQVLKVVRLRRRNTIVQGARTKSDFATEVASQMVAAEIGFAVQVDDYFVCGADDTPELAFLLMPLVDGENLGLHVNSAEAGGYHCEQIRDVGPPSVNGYMAKDMYYKLAKAADWLDEAGVWFNDFNAGNAKVDRKTGRLVFVDFSTSERCTRKKGQAVAAALGNMGCPLPEGVVLPHMGLKCAEKKRW